VGERSELSDRRFSLNYARCVPSDKTNVNDTGAAAELESALKFRMGQNATLVLEFDTSGLSRTHRFRRDTRARVTL